jgi:UDP-N-acetylglucosamine:LPS N-acetylglucosamine transferase
LAVASAGGHWIQLLRLQPAWLDCDVAFLSTDPSVESMIDGPARFYAATEASRWEKLKLLKSAAQVALVLLRERPDVVITTGAAAGYFAILFGRLLGSRTIWIDSIANAEEISLSGKKAAKFAHVFLTQWPDLKRSDRPDYWGSVL